MILGFFFFKKCIIQGHVHINMSLNNILFDQQLIIWILLKEGCLQNYFIAYVNRVWCNSISKHEHRLNDTCMYVIQGKCVFDIFFLIIVLLHKRDMYASVYFTTISFIWYSILAYIFLKDVYMYRNNLKYNAFSLKFNVNFVPNVSLISEL